MWVNAPDKKYSSNRQINVLAHYTVTDYVMADSHSLDLYIVESEVQFVKPWYKWVYILSIKCIFM